MSTLTVWKFSDASGAQEAVSTLKSLQAQELIRVHDAAVVEWPANRRKPKTRQLHNLAGSGALGGAFWGMLFGLLFLTPMLGAAIGAAAGALMGSLSDVGIDDNFIDKVKSSVTQGTSALFVLSSDAVQDKVSAAFDGVSAELVHTNLSDEDEQRLRAAFLEDDSAEEESVAR